MISDGIVLFVEVILGKDLASLMGDDGREGYSSVFTMVLSVMRRELGLPLPSGVGCGLLNAMGGRY